MKSLILVLLLAPALAATAAPSDVSLPHPYQGWLDRGWIPFQSEDGRFRVMLPGLPTERVATQESFMGRVYDTRYSVADTDCEFTVEFHDIPTLATRLASNDYILDRAANTVLTNSGGLEPMRSEVTVAGLPGRQLHYRLSESDRVEDALLVLAGNRLYVVRVERPEEHEASPGFAAFLGSFEAWLP